MIIHSRYHGEDFNRIQVVWLKLECPFDGSIKGLCLNFFHAIDSILGTNYYENYGRKGRATVDELLPNMARVSLLHGIGVLVIDEIQHLNEAKSGGARRMLNFLVELVNTGGMPVIPVGTYKAAPILGGEFRQARRSAGQGDLFWYAMKEDDTWELFLESLWMYQYTKKPTDRTPELSHALYDVTQGITDLAAKVYMLAQVRAITRGDDEDESITEELIRSVAYDSLRLANPILEALRSGNILELHKVDDVLPIDIEPFIQEALRNYNQATKPDPDAESDQTNQGKGEATEQQATPASESTPVQKQVNGSPPAVKGSSKNKKDSTTKPHGDLLEAVSQEIKNNKSAYEALLKAGYFKPTDENFLKKDIQWSVLSLPCFQKSRSTVFVRDTVIGWNIRACDPSFRSCSVMRM